MFGIFHDFGLRSVNWYTKYQMYHSESVEEYMESMYLLNLSRLYDLTNGVLIRPLQCYVEFVTFLTVFLI